MRQILAHSILWVIGLLPTLAALLLMPSSSFDDAAAILSSLGRLTALPNCGKLITCWGQ